MAEGLIHGQMVRQAESSAHRHNASIDDIGADERFCLAAQRAIDAALAARAAINRLTGKASTDSAARKRVRLGLDPSIEMVTNALALYPSNNAMAWERLCIATLGIGMAQAYAMEASRLLVGQAKRNPETIRKGGTANPIDQFYFVFRAVRADDKKGLRSKARSANELAERILIMEDQPFGPNAKRTVLRLITKVRKGLEDDS